MVSLPIVRVTQIFPFPPILFHLHRPTSSKAFLFRAFENNAIGKRSSIEVIRADLEIIVTPTSYLPAYQLPTYLLPAYPSRHTENHRGRLKTWWKSHCKIGRDTWSAERSGNDGSYLPIQTYREYSRELDEKTEEPLQDAWDLYTCSCLRHGIPQSFSNGIDCQCLRQFVSANETAARGWATGYET